MVFTKFVTFKAGAVAAMFAAGASASVADPVAHRSLRQEVPAATPTTPALTSECAGLGFYDCYYQENCHWNWGTKACDVGAITNPPEPTTPTPSACSGLGFYDCYYQDQCHWNWNTKACDEGKITNPPEPNSA
ncbi:hypothetical protein Poli38472_001766 [Pythium oligandrum]|uniref:Uncharacterized protein n=1 Tax=Pythium oligandrum TaxID=41045 RepID=A0A8K1CU21_PYTOL|nr:hypothetical protein Poli38472_001766 [Pythium oligandrum]|eukprot:TMW69610.1 hypothetical protein Poli38472_001766 [Pythium oligandrum]